MPSTNCARVNFACCSSRKHSVVEVGAGVGIGEGAVVGAVEGDVVGMADGALVGVAVGAVEGRVVGMVDGALVGGATKSNSQHTIEETCCKPWAPPAKPSLISVISVPCGQTSFFSPL